jgi:hypothetical protein
MPNNHSKHGIPGNIHTCPGSHLRPRRHGPVRLPGHGPVRLCRHGHVKHGRACVHAPGSLAREALDLYAAVAEEHRHGPLRLLRRDTRQDHPPLGCLQREGAQRCRGLVHLDHVYPVRQCRIEPLPHLGSIAPLRQRQFQVLGLARRPRRGRARVGNLRVRCEPRRISDGQPGPANSPLNSTRHVPVAGETHPASFSVPDNQALSDPGHTTRTGWLETRHPATSRPRRGPRSWRGPRPRRGPPGQAGP